MSKHIVDLDPHWIRDAASRVVGVRFACPTCTSLEGAVNICVLFRNPLDGGQGAPEGCGLPGDNGGERWERAGSTFETLTLSPSVDCSRCGHWHGFVAKGDV